MLSKLKQNLKAYLLNRWRHENPIQFGRTCFSQEGEDALLWRLMDSDHSPAVYVDVGSNHPFHMSNTALFYEQGWRGVAIDPNPNYSADYQCLRPLDTFVNCGVAANAGAMEYFEFEQPLFNTFDAKKAASINGKHSRQISIRKVPVRPLREILNDIWPDGQSIRVLSVDCEGMDLEVLQSHDFEKHTVEFVCVEVEDAPLSTYRTQKPIEFLENRGYISIAKLYKSAILVKASNAAKWGIQIEAP